MKIQTNRLVCMVLAFIMAMFVYANDGVYYTSGNQLVPLAETDIQVKKEILTISLQDNKKAKVDVYYEFLNPGNNAKTVMMGFEADPSYNDDYKFHPDGVHPQIFDFTVEMNGKKLGYKNAVCNLEGKGMFNPIDSKKWDLDEEGGTSLINKADKSKQIDRFAYVYYFNAEFQPGINKVHHTYSYTMSETVGTVFEVAYKLSPATRWANHQIDDFTLIVRADNTAKHFLISKDVFGETKFAVSEGKGKIRINDGMYEVSLRNGAIKLHKNQFRMKGEGELNIVSADMRYTYNENAKFGTFYDRSSTLYLDAWGYSEHKVKISNQLKERVTKNLPYAHRGHVFKDATLKKYFESLWWYMPDPTYKDDTKDFTETDWYYVRMGK